MSVIVLTYNSAAWLPKCLSSLCQQTIFPQMEIIVVDNASTDETVQLARSILEAVENSRIVVNAENLGFCEGNNVGARLARGQYLFFMNPDAWLERDCLENLVREVRQQRASAAMPLVFDYEDHKPQDVGYTGLDFFGFPSRPRPWRETRLLFIAEGCALLVDRTEFFRVGGFDPVLFMYADEWDLCWRIWLSGGRIIGVPTACAHHRGAVAANPRGGTRITEFRTSDKKRFLANRNGIYVLMKNASSVLLLFVPLQLLYLFIESMVVSVLIRRGGYFKAAFIDVILDLWRLRSRILQERVRIRSLRTKSDWWFLRFLRLRLNRWDELKRVFKFGLPRIDPMQVKDRNKSD